MVKLVTKAKIVCISTLVKSSTRGKAPVSEQAYGQERGREGTWVRGPELDAQAESRYVSQMRKKTLIFQSTYNIFIHASQIHTCLPKATFLHVRGPGHMVKPLGTLGLSTGQATASPPIPAGRSQRAGGNRPHLAPCPGELGGAFGVPHLPLLLCPGRLSTLHSCMGSPYLLGASNWLRFGGKLRKGSPQLGLGPVLQPAFQRARKPSTKHPTASLY